MGIQGLIPFCEPATTQTNISQIRGSSVAVDSYCLLHRGAYGVSDKLVKGIKTTGHIDFAVKYVQMLLSHRIKPIMVFDGRNLPAKALTEIKRRKDRDAAKEKAAEFLRAGKIEEARKEYTKSVDITHAHAIELMNECRKLGVDCITAMYEADSQLAYLNRIGLADYIISEDSDLILFGCSKIIFKLQLDGRCLLFEAEKLFMCLNTTEDKFSFEKFRRICILSGCDYLNSLHGIGLAKARKFILMTEETDMRRALLKIPTYLNMKKLSVTEEYIDGFLKAEATFKYMFVYDPRKREMVRLNDLDEDDPEKEHCSNAGELLDHPTAYQLALGNLNPRSFKEMYDFDPDSVPAKKQNPSDKRPSIWSRNSNSKITPSSTYQKQSNISKFFSNAPRKHQILDEVQNIIDQENNVTSEIEMNDLLMSYTDAKIIPSKRRNDETENDEDHKLTSPSRNPFAKRHQTSIEPEKKPSLLESISKDDSKKLAKNLTKLNFKVISPFFVAKKTTSIELYSEKSEETVDDSESAFSFDSTKKDSNYQEFYQAFKTEDESENTPSQTSLDHSDNDADLANTSETKLSDEDNNFVDLDNYCYKEKTMSQTFLSESKPKILVARPMKMKFRGPGLSKVKPVCKKPSEDGSVQTKLSKFGFQKRSAFT